MISYQEAVRPTPHVEALESAIYFAALCTLSPDEIEDRDVQLMRYRSATEASLTRAGLLTTTNIVTLQAFVIYLVRYTVTYKRTHD